MNTVSSLKKPFTASQRADFIVKYNHELGFKIEENDEEILALDYDDKEKKNHEKEIKKAEMIKKRNQALKDTDFYLISDYPISDEDLEKIKQYRQELRDLPQKKRFPFVKFPTKPF